MCVVYLCGRRGSSDNRDGVGPVCWIMLHGDLEEMAFGAVVVVVGGGW